MAVEPPLIFVTVGTDHHPFNRLIHWVDTWVRDRSYPMERCVMQTGTSVKSPVAKCQSYLTVEEMRELLETASAVVCHGGPGTIFGCRAAGRVPIVVPRRARLGEHVDDHQVAFTRRLAQAGEIELCGDQEEMWQLLDRVVRDPDAFRSTASSSSSDAVRRFAELVDGLARRSSSSL
jgi:UDP-N-acetylglucosamine transferase subunit ALG13